MKRNLFIFLVVNFFILSVGSLQAQERGVEIRPVGRELFEAEPRQIVTTIFQVTNTGEKREEFVAEVKIPQEWKLITKEFPFELDPGESDMRLVSFFIPQKTLAGKYEATYLIKEKKYPAISDFYTICVVVLPVAKLEVKLLEAPEYIIAGKDYQASFVVINQGNVGTTINLNIESGENWPATTEAEKFKLNPAESKIVEVRVKTDEKIHRKMKHRLKLTAQTAKFEFKATSWVEIIPRITGVDERFHRIPTEITFRGVSEKNEEEKQGFQAEISGSGTLDEEREKHIDFFLTGPDISDKSAFGERDEYRLSYWTDKYGLYLGDRIYSLSPLTEYYRYGRGIEGKIRLNNFILGGWKEKSRWIEPKEEETAGYIDYLIQEKHKLSLNYLKKSSDSEIFSFRGQFEPSRDTSLDLEYGSGEKDGKSDNAYWLKTFGHLKKISSYLTIIHAGPDYPGYYKDMDFKWLSLGVPLRKNLRLNGYFREQKRNLNLDPTYSAPLDKSYGSGINYKFRSGTNVSLSYRDRTREDLLPDPEFNYQEETFKLGVGHSFKKLSLHSSGEWGKTKDKLTDQSSDLERYIFSIYFRPTGRQSYSTYLHYGDDYNLTSEHRQTLSAGLNLFLQTGKRTQLSANLRTSKQEETRIHNLLNISLRHKLLNEQVVSISGRSTSYENTETKYKTALMIEYTIPFGLPISKKKNIGVIKGYVYDKETKEGMPDVILKLNEATAVTDKKGNFIFPSLKPGTYYLNVDRASIGLNRITTQKTPMEIIVEEGKETSVEIGITESSSLSGQVIVYGFASNHNNLLEGENRNNSFNVVGEGDNGSSLNSTEAETVKSYGLANILVEITNGSEIKRRVTDGKGYFSFEELRPGKWILKIYDDNLPGYHYLEKDIFEFELKPADKEEVIVKVLPKERPIHIIEEGGTLEEENE